MSEAARVLIVDDEPPLVELYAEWLGDDYHVTTATSGAEALALVDDSFDVVLLDRRMPENSGDEVVAELRDRGVNCRVAMVTAVTPDFDILDLAFDDYLTKPVTAETLRETIDGLVQRSTYDEQFQRYFSLATKRAALESEKNAAELEGDGRYRDVLTELESLEAEFETVTTELSEEDQVALLKEF